MYELIYKSRARQNFSNSDLEKMLSRAQIKNKSKDITGLLVFDGQHFLQILEGEREVVEATFEHIQKDERHCEFERFWSQSSGSIKNRAFAEWSMASVHLQEGSLEGDVKSLMESSAQSSLGKRLFRILLDRLKDN